MPTAPPKPCAQPGCYTLTLTGWCPSHRPASEHVSAAKRGYGRPHRRWRELILARDLICCGWPAGVACWDPATQADHIIPIAKGGQPLDLDNGQGLCATHHSRKTRSEMA